MNAANIFVLVFLSFITISIILTLCLHYSGSELSSGNCLVKISQLSEKNESLLLQQNNGTHYLTAFKLPDRDGNLFFKAGEKIDIACSGAENQLLVNGMMVNNHISEATCIGDENFKIIGKTARLQNITCLKRQESVARENNNNTCGRNKTFTEIEIGITVSGRFINHFVVCFNKLSLNSLYSHQTLSASISGFRRNFISPGFNSQFYDVTPYRNVDDLYERKKQRDTVNTILGFDLLDESIINNGSNNSTYLSRGHYTASADFFYFSQRTLTYYYVNTAPQWSMFNQNNWKSMEEDCRTFASEKQLDLKVYTGSHEVTTLPDTEKTLLKKLYLFPVDSTKPAKIAVPQLFYRVVYNEEDRTGVAFVGVNNPYALYFPDDIICPDVCDQISWIRKWDRKNIVLGYIYCCKIEEFQKRVLVLPPFDNYTLLT